MLGAEKPCNLIFGTFRLVHQILEDTIPFPYAIGEKSGLVPSAGVALPGLVWIFAGIWESKYFASWRFE